MLEVMLLDCTLGLVLDEGKHQLVVWSEAEAEA